MAEYNSEKRMAGGAQSMMWCKFLTHGFLIALPIICAVLGIAYMIGYFREENVDSLIRALDVFYGLGLLGIAALGFIARGALFWDKKTGPKNLITFFSLLVGATIVHSLGIFALTNSMFNLMIVILFVIGGPVLIALNAVYFKNRKSIYKY